MLPIISILNQKILTIEFPIYPSVSYNFLIISYTNLILRLQKYKDQADTIPKIRKYIKVINMTTKQNVSCESENMQYFQKYPEENISFIDILNNNCLANIFKFLPLVDRLNSERGEYPTLYMYFADICLKTDIVICFHVYI